MVYLDSWLPYLDSWLPSFLPLFTCAFHIKKKKKKKVIPFLCNSGKSQGDRWWRCQDGTNGLLSYKSWRVHGLWKLKSLTWSCQKQVFRPWSHLYILGVYKVGGHLLISQHSNMFLGIWYLLIWNMINNYDVISLLESISLYRLASLSTNTFYVCSFIFRTKKMNRKLVCYGTRVMNGKFACSRVSFG